METFIALIVVGVLMCVYGAFVFAGNDVAAAAKAATKATTHGVAAAAGNRL